MSNPCPAGYKCADVSGGFNCKCVDSSKCDLDKPGCEDNSCIKGMKYFLFFRSVANSSVLLLFRNYSVSIYCSHKKSELSRWLCLSKDLASILWLCFWCL